MQTNSVDLTYPQGFRTDPLINFNNIDITFYSFHFADEKNFTTLSYRGLI